MPNIIVRQNAKYGCSAVVQNIVVRQECRTSYFRLQSYEKKQFHPIIIFGYLETHKMYIGYNSFINTQK